MIPQKKIDEILASQQFRQLVVKRWTISIFLTVLILVVYIGFILLVAFHKELMSTKIGDHVTLALPLGFGLIVFAWVLTGIYVTWANKKYDPEVKKIKNELLKNS